MLPKQKIRKLLIIRDSMLWFSMNDKKLHREVTKGEVSNCLTDVLLLIRQINE